jgi:uncharacterized protein (TIGR02611 family)
MTDAGQGQTVGVEDVEPEFGPPKWLRPLRDKVLARPGGALAWRVLIAVLGGAVVILGIVLLPLPGPGWAVIFGGLAIWGTEFVWAQRLLAFARRTVSEWTAWLLRQSWPVRLLVGLVGLLFLAGVFYLVWLVLWA